MKMLVFSPWQPLWLPSLKPRQRLQLSRITDMVDTEATVGMEATVDTALEDTGDTTASERPRLSPTMATEDTVEDTEATGATVLGTPGATTASVRLRLSPTMATEDTVEDTEDTEATGAMVATVVATTASVRPRLSPTMAMEDTVEDMVDTVEVTEATEVTVMASSMFPTSSNVAPP